jgi:membrane protease YdiL (CAAX protease family)
MATHVLATDVTVRTWAILTEASAAASVAVVPYLLSVQRDALAVANARRIVAGKRPMTPARLAALAAVQGQVTFGIATGLGLRAARTMGLGLPHLDNLLRGKPSGLHISQAAAYAAAGAVSALAIAALDYTLFAGVRKNVQEAIAHPPEAWRGLLAVPYGAIAEEVLLRLCVQTFCAAGLRRLRVETATPASGATMWPAILISALLFGAGHLPTVSRMTPLTPALIARALLLNGIAGAVFGYLYWKRGLEAAMVAHGTADVVLHVGGPLVQRRQA